MLWSVAIAVSAATVVLGQRPARIGPDGKPLLNRPVMEECQKSEWKNHEKNFSMSSKLQIFTDKLQLLAVLHFPLSYECNYHMEWHYTWKSMIVMSKVSI